MFGHDSHGCGSGAGEGGGAGYAGDGEWVDEWVGDAVMQEASHGKAPYLRTRAQGLLNVGDIGVLRVFRLRCLRFGGSGVAGA